MTADGGGDRARLSDLSESLDAERFVGRDAELEVARGMLAGSAAGRVLYVHGPAGVGKSALLRAIERLAGADRAVIHVDARTVDAVPDALADALAPATESDLALVVLDEVDELASIRVELRDLVLQLPAASVVVIAGRRPPGWEWSDASVEHLTVIAALQPLDPATGQALLARQGITDQAECDRLLQWSAGYPLALTVAAAAHPIGPDDDLVAGSPNGTLSEILLDRLAGRELDDVDPDALDVAAVAPAVDARLLAAVLPGRPTRDMLMQLRRLSVAEPLGPSITLHRLVRTAVRERLKTTDPEHYRELVLATAEHLWSRSQDEPRMMYRLADLLENPEVFIGFGPSTTHFADRLRPGDTDRLGAELDAVGTAWWQRFLRWCDELPGRVMVVREVSGLLVAVSIVLPIDEMPDWAEDDIETGPVLRHARALGPTTGVVAMHDLHVLQDPSDAVANAEINRVGNIAAARYTGLHNPLRTYVTQEAKRPDDGSEPLGYGEVEALSRSDDERSLITVMADFGPGGIAGAVYGMIRAEQGADSTEPNAQAGADLLAALRTFRDDTAMAASPFGEVEGDADSARAEIRAIVTAAFTDAATDRELELAIRRTYLDPDGGHAAARAELHMGRSTFYRHLQRARDRVVDSVTT